MDVDRCHLAVARPGVEQEAVDDREQDERGHDPMQRHGEGAVAAQPGWRGHRRNGIGVYGARLGHPVSLLAGLSFRSMSNKTGCRTSSLKTQVTLAPSYACAM